MSLMLVLAGMQFTMKPPVVPPAPVVVVVPPAPVVVVVPPEPVAPPLPVNVEPPPPEDVDPPPPLVLDDPPLPPLPVLVLPPPPPPGPTISPAAHASQSVPKQARITRLRRCSSDMTAALSLVVEEALE